MEQQVAADPLQVNDGWKKYLESQRGTMAQGHLTQAQDEARNSPFQGNPMTPPTAPRGESTPLGEFQKCLNLLEVHRRRVIITRATKSITRDTMPHLDPCIMGIHARPMDPNSRAPAKASMSR